MTGPLLTSSEAADRLRMGKRATLRLLNAGQLGGSFVGRQWLVSEKDLQAFLDANRNHAPTEARRRRRN